ncbi:hypothetical protein B0H14DRAFT_2655749 [Mycena olivaceomarginata]|nr:hypothetical protein B0H14DRAFT_2655749 [Mycena olivaceomarginata]
MLKLALCEEEFPSAQELIECSCDFFLVIDLLANLLRYRTSNKRTLLLCHIELVPNWAPLMPSKSEFAVPLRQLVGLPRQGVKFVAVTANLNSRPATFDIASMSARTYRMTRVSYEHRPDQKRNPHRINGDTTWAEAVLLCDPNLLHFRDTNLAALRSNEGGLDALLPSVPPRSRGADSTRFECLFEFSVTPVNPSAGCLFEILGAWFDASQKRAERNTRLSTCAVLPCVQKCLIHILEAVFFLQSGNNLSDSAAKFSLS